MSDEQKFIVEEQAAGQRLDVFCVPRFPALSRSALQKAIKNGQIQVNGQTVKPKHMLKAGEVITAQLPEASAVLSETGSLESVPALELPIIYEDKDVVVINKPPGVAVHQGTGLSGQATIASWVATRYPDLEPGVGQDEHRPGIVHRLDKDTSGVLIIAKTPKAYTELKAQFKRRNAKKEYLALVFGIPTGETGRVNQALARSPRNPMRRTIDPQGKEAISEWKLEEKFQHRYALVRVFPLTGRTHQIRVHLHFLGHPIVGDALYTFKRQKPPQGVTRQLLHAEKLIINLPTAGQKTFTAPLPEDFDQVLNNLRDPNAPLLTKERG